MKKIHLNVEGMSCEHCVKHVTEALEGVPDVKKAKVSLKKNSAEVTAQDSVTPESLVAAVVEAGYEASVA